MSEQTPAGPAGPLAGFARAVDRVVGSLDRAVPVERSPANTALQDGTRALAWIGLLLAIAALLLIPWVFYIGFALPERQLSSHYAIAWAGFDALLFVALATTAYAVLRRSSWVGMSAGAAAAMLVTDAWFDVVTAPNRHELIGSILMAAVVELPLAVACVWLCRHAKRVEDRRLLELLGERAAGGGR